MSTVMLAIRCQLRRQSVTRGRSDLGRKLIECAEPNFEESAQPDSVRTPLESGSTGFSKGESYLIMANGVELWGSNPSDVPLLQVPALPESQVLTNCWLPASRVEGGLKRNSVGNSLFLSDSTDLF